MLPARLWKNGSLATKRASAWSRTSVASAFSISPSLRASAISMRWPRLSAASFVARSLEMGAIVQRRCHRVLLLDIGAYGTVAQNGGRGVVYQYTRGSFGGGEGNLVGLIFSSDGTLKRIAYSSHI